MQIVLFLSHILWSSRWLQILIIQVVAVSGQLLQAVVRHGGLASRLLGFVLFVSLNCLFHLFVSVVCLFFLFLASRLHGWGWDSLFQLFVWIVCLFAFLLVWIVCLFVSFFFFLPAGCLGGSGIVCFIWLFGLFVCLFVWIVFFSSSCPQVAWVGVG